MCEGASIHDTQGGCSIKALNAGGKQHLGPYATGFYKEKGSK